MVLLRYDGRPQDVLRESGFRVLGGETFEVSEERAAELLANREVPVSAVEVPGVHPEGQREPALPDGTAPEVPEDLRKLKRAELNGLAASLGVEAPQKLRNIDAVIAAIEAQLPAPDGDGHDGQHQEPAQGSGQNPDEKEE